MNELHTPPGYVEYPRDSKFRPLDKIGRLELVAKGYLASRFSLLVVAPILELWILRQPSRMGLPWTWVWGPSVILVAWLTLGVQAGLGRVMRSDAKEPALATFLAVALGGTGLVLCSGDIPAIWSAAFFLAPAVTFYIVQRSLLAAEYKRFGITMPRFLTGIAVDHLVADLRRAEFGIDGQGIQLTAPTGGPGLDEIAKLEAMTKGCYTLKWTGPAAMVLSFLWRAHPWHFTTFLGLTLSLSLLLFVLVGLWASLSRFSVGGGFNPVIAGTLTAAFAVIGLLASFGYLSFPVAAAVFFVPFIALLGWIRQSTVNEFAKYGRTMPAWMDRYRSAKYFYDLRQETSKQAGPSLAEELLEARG